MGSVSSLVEMPSPNPTVALSAWLNFLQKGPDVAQGLRLPECVTEEVLTWSLFSHMWLPVLPGTEHGGGARLWPATLHLLPFVALHSVPSFPLRQELVLLAKTK